MTKIEKLLKWMEDNHEKDLFLEADEIYDYAQNLLDEEDEEQQSKLDDERDIEMYGDPNDDEYNMSDSHRADCESEKWDWIKNA